MADPFEVRAERLQESLVFGEVAQELGLSGSSRAGWDCPACQCAATVRERSDHMGARCTHAACGKGFSFVGLVMAAEHKPAMDALRWLEDFVERRDAGGGDASDMFEGV
ncbi:hypothetical protein [Hyphomonas pacifica]|uniref:Uncharacterized protein n=1 Tax=Hyphomonas pacifica TaxID=1280941 RepID=A0A8B2PMI2_9PROT|nr:hypothetical protein [Hyphomonas pacifica]RAN30651.1 hypothetical protein HY3_05735 [Hyphomonas pacifica]